ncbi:MAG TPA: hypothetical protein VF131_14510 [Blastocatellia bacterium]|nr:hypothetical protein [Blastocatellia bacterium]
MPGLIALASLLLFVTHAQQPPPKPAAVTKQLFAVRGQVVAVKSQGKGLLLITIKPPRGFAEVSVLARENDLVGRGVGGTADSSLFGLLTGETPEDETITAAELGEGDVVSVIYDPQTENRVVEIYLH